MRLDLHDVFEAGCVELFGWRVFFELSASSNGLRYVELSIQPCD